MARFYGMHPDQIGALDIFTFADLWNAITVLEAQEFLIQANLRMLPHMKPEARKDLLNEMHREAYPKQFKPATAAITAKEMADRLAVRGKSGRRK